MLESSPTSLQEYPCVQHKRQRVTHICTDFRCANSPLLCGLCLAEPAARSLHGAHEEFLLPIHEAIPELAVIIDSSKAEMSKLFMATAARKESEQLLKKIELGERLHQQLEGHMKSVRLQVEREFEAVQSEFLWRWHQAKQCTLASLDSYQKTYSQNMETYRQMIEPVVTFSSRSKYYSNPNSISLKLLAEIKRKSIDWYLELKRIMTFATKLAERPHALLEGYVRTTQYMITLAADELPALRDAQDARSSRLQQLVNELAADIIVLKEIKPLSNADQEPPQATVYTARSNLPLQPHLQAPVGSQKELPANGPIKIALKPTIRY